MTQSYKNNDSSAINGIYNLLLSVFILAALYFGQRILIPLSLAILLTFLLTPSVSNLEKLVGRIPAVSSVVILIFIGINIIGYVISQELTDLITELPQYKTNIIAKINSIPFLQTPVFTEIWGRLQNTTIFPEKIAASPVIAQTAQAVLSALIHTLVSIGFVLLLVIFMLVNREDLTSRIIRLTGTNHKKIATRKALDEAGVRISHYLLMQLIINTGFGILLIIGLYFIGIPNAILWGGLLIVLRFIPYVGTWLSAIVPIALSFLISTSWLTPILTISLYLFLDLISTNFLEPLLFGAKTGVSSTALIIAAVFWTLLWGPVGLLLAIPLTVCLVVIGKHVPQFQFLNILLGDE